MNPNLTELEIEMDHMTRWEWWRVLDRECKSAIRDHWLRFGRPYSITQPIRVKKERREWLLDELYFSAIETLRR